jgi:uncharacterized membrane protein
MDGFSLLLLGCLLALASIPFPKAVHLFFEHFRRKKALLSLPSSSILFYKTPLIVAFGFLLEGLKGVALYLGTIAIIPDSVGLQLMVLSLCMMVSFRSPWNGFSFSPHFWIAALGVLVGVYPLLLIPFAVSLAFMTVITNHWLFGIIGSFGLSILMIVRVDSELGIPLAISIFVWSFVLHADFIFNPDKSFKLIDLYKRR